MNEELPTHDSGTTVRELRLVLLARSGSEKTKVRRAILGGEKRNWDATQGQVAGRKVTMVDAPDWFFPDLPLEKLRQEMMHCVQLCSPGPHVFLLVIPIKQLTGEEEGRTVMLEKLEAFFDEKCWTYTMILFTVSEQRQKSIEEFVRSGDQEVQRLVEKCGTRFHAFNIKESGDGTEVSEMLEKIEKMVEENREEFYSSEIKENNDMI